MSGENISHVNFYTYITGIILCDLFWLSGEGNATFQKITKTSYLKEASSLGTVANAFSITVMYTNQDIINRLLILVIKNPQQDHV